MNEATESEFHRLARKLDDAIGVASWALERVQRDPDKRWGFVISSLNMRRGAPDADTPEEAIKNALKTALDDANRKEADLEVKLRGARDEASRVRGIVESAK